MAAFIHPTAVVDQGARIGDETRIWHFCHVMAGAEIGPQCSLGQGCFVSAGARVGSGVRVQNNVSLYDGVVLEDEVFIGPCAVFTNVTNPRAAVSRRAEYQRTVVKRGATVGANATVMPGRTLGRYCFVAAGAVVVHDVPDFALVMGVPARQTGWMSRHGRKLTFDAEGFATCPGSGQRYRLMVDGSVVELG
ncbi:MAG: N-acetyltransferase [Polyangiaceae bacterium]|nr:N-acetyltransferase [Polyangiaceae bacterium]